MRREGGGKSMKAWALAAAVLAAASAAAQAPSAREYDAATEVTVRGEVTATHESKAATDHPGLHLVLKTEPETIEVHACPVRFLEELEFTTRTGDTVTVIGSRKTEPPVIVAREIRKGQQSLVLRDKDGVPNWTPR
jgi:hypothetical protein